MSKFGKSWNDSDLAQLSPAMRAQAERQMRSEAQTKKQGRSPARACASQLGPELNGITFGSKLERRRAEALVVRARAGEIADLVLHPRYSLSAAAISYTADSEYVLTATRQTITEDVKPEDWRKLKIHSRFRDLVKLWAAYGPHRLRVATWAKGSGWTEQDVPGKGRDA